jgi:hypothetical protein
MLPQEIANFAFDYSSVVSFPAAQRYRRSATKASVAAPNSFGPPVKHEIAEHRLARIVHLAAPGALCKDVAQLRQGKYPRPCSAIRRDLL